MLENLPEPPRLGELDGEAACWLKTGDGTDRGWDRGGVGGSFIMKCSELDGDAAGSVSKTL